MTFIGFLCCFLSGVAEANQELIMAQGGISLLATTAADADDAQTLRMVAGAIANLCGNGILHSLLFICFVRAHYDIISLLVHNEIPS